MINWLKEQKFKTLIEENLTHLVQFAYARCHDICLAEDLVQETCIKAYKSFMQKDEKEIIKPKEWLFRILINTHINHTRKKQLKIVYDSDLSRCELEDSSEVSSDLTIDKEVKDEILREDLEKALLELGADQRSAIYLVDIKQMEVKEASKTLGIPFGTLMSRLHRGRQNLKKILTNYGYSKDYLKVGGLT